MLKQSIPLSNPLDRLKEELMVSVLLAMEKV